MVFSQILTRRNSGHGSVTSAHPVISVHGGDSLHEGAQLQLFGHGDLVGGGRLEDRAVLVARHLDRHVRRGARAGVGIVVGHHRQLSDNNDNNAELHH